MTQETVYFAADPSGIPIRAEVDASDPLNPNIRLEAGCNEFWLNLDEARAVVTYLQRVIPFLEKHKL